MQLCSDKAAFMTVVYPGCENYLEDFMASVSRQTCRAFDLFFVNDGFPRAEEFAVRYGLEYREIPACGVPAKNKESGLNQLIGLGYSRIVIGDSDDYFDDNRVETALRLLERFDIVVNDFDVVGQDGSSIKPRYFSKRVNDMTEITPDFVAEKNIFGLSNLAVKFRKDERVSFHPELLAIDWYLGSYLMNKGYRAVFTNATTTYYRQHQANALGMELRERDKILKGLRSKVLYYHEMSRLESGFARLYEKYRALDERVNSSDGALEKYLAAVRRSGIENPFWFEDIILVEGI